MNFREYGNLSQVTAPDPGDEGTVHRLMGNLSRIMYTLGHLKDLAQGLDKIKGHVYYGKESDYALTELPTNEIKSLLENQPWRVKLIHGWIGMVSELCDELFEPIARILAGADDIKQHRLNIKEEIGDILWFLNEFSTACGIQLEDAAEANIAKLRKRFGDRFDAAKAINRDKDAEYEAMERVQVEVSSDKRTTQQIIMDEKALRKMLTRVLPLVEQVRMDHPTVKTYQELLESTKAALA